MADQDSFVSKLSLWLKRLGGADEVLLGPPLEISLDVACVVCIEGHARFRTVSSRFDHDDVPHMLSGDVHYLFWTESALSKMLLYTNGTSSFVGLSLLTKCTISVSPLKSDWIQRPDHEMPPKEIPPELLAMCGQPSVLLDIEVCESPSGIKNVVSRTAVTCCMAFLDDSRITHLPEGYTSRHFEEAVTVLTTGCVYRSTGDGEYYRKVREFLEDVAEYTGTPEVLATVKIHLEQMACLADNDPEWLFGIVEDKKMMFAYSEHPTIDITYGVARGSVGLRTPHRNMDKWRFLKTVPAVVPTDPQVFVSPHHSNLARVVEDCLPRYLKTVMQQFAGNIVLAGGKVVGQILQNTCRGNDFDLFCCDESDSTPSEGIMDAAMTMLIKETCVLSTLVTSNAVTMVTNDNYKIQFITRNTYRSVGDMLHSFDIAACQAAFMYTPIENKSAECFGKSLKVTPAFMECAVRNSFWIDLAFDEESVLPRSIKYFFKGLEMYVPGYAVLPVEPEYSCTSMSLEEAKEEIQGLIKHTQAPRNSASKTPTDTASRAVDTLGRWTSVIHRVLDHHPDKMHELVCRAVLHHSWRWSS